MSRTLAVLLLIDAALVVAAIAMAVQTQHSPGQDAAGRGMVWIIPFYAGVFFALPLLLWVIRLPRVATVAACVPALFGAFVLLRFGAAIVGEGRVTSGSAVFSDPTTRRVAAAIARADAARVRRLVAEGAALDVPSPDSVNTLLTWTIRQHPGETPLLLQLGANPNFTFGTAQPPLIVAMIPERPDLVRALLDAGADPNTPDPTLKNPVMYIALLAHDPQMFRLLVDHGADLTRLDWQGHTLAMAAAATERWAIATLALDRGVDPSHVAPDGKSLQSILEAQSLGPVQLADPAYLALREKVKQLGIPVERKPAPTG